MEDTALHLQGLFTLKEGSKLANIPPASGDLVSMAGALPGEFPIVALASIDFQKMMTWMEPFMETALEISREGGHGFTGPRIMGTLARALTDPQAKRAALQEGEGMLQAGSVGHNYFYFYVDAIDVSLELGDWDAAEGYATALEEFAESEPLPWSSYFAARGRALAAHGRGRRDPEILAELRRLQDEAERVGFRTPLPPLKEALGE